MGRSPCCAKEGLNRGAWTALEDRALSEYIKIHGEGGWRNLPKKAGLKRCGKSCRLRWLNYLRPDIKRGNISSDEEELIVRLHKLLGNRWSLIAGRLPGRTDNEIKNYWNTNLSKRVHQEHEARSSSITIGNNERSLKKAKDVVTSHNVVRTKASKCNKVFIKRHLQSKGLFLSDDHKPLEALEHQETNKNELLPSPPLPENSSTSDFLVDFGIDSEACLANLLGDDHLFSEELLQLHQSYWSENVVGGNCDDEQCQLNPIISYKSLSSFNIDANQGDWLELAETN